MPGPAATLGVEEEYQIVDPATRQLRSRAGRVLPLAREALGDEVAPELYQSQIEVGTPVCGTLAEARAELVRLRRAVIAAAGRDGGRIAAAGTHPFSRWEDQARSPKPRYDDLVALYQQLARELVTFGCHVHVGVEDREVAIRVMNGVAPWLAPILALSANSPFWQGVDTGFASYRTEVFGRFPLSGVPRAFADRADYDATVADLVASGLIEDASNLYWDVRPSMHFETIEFRIADVAATVDEAVLVAGLCRGLALACRAAVEGGGPVDLPRPELIRASTWFAARHGIDGVLLDLAARRPAPAADVVAQLLAFLRPTLEDLGDWDEVRTLADAVLRGGNGARRQRDAYRRAGRFEDVVDAIVAATGRGLA